jgi:hypothetical protein
VPKGKFDIVTFVLFSVAKTGKVSNENRLEDLTLRDKNVLPSALFPLRLSHQRGYMNSLHFE